jgi:hypothetical protein
MATAAPASTSTVAEELVELCRAGRNLDAINKFYSPKIVSIESVGSETMPAEMTGIEAIRGKNEWWFANNEVHSSTVRGPFVGGQQFVVQYEWDTTFKPTSERSVMSELALYTVKDGKVVHERFYYHVPGA